MQCASALRDEVPKWLGHDWQGEIKFQKNRKTRKLALFVSFVRFVFEKISVKSVLSV